MSRLQQLLIDAAGAYADRPAYVVANDEPIAVSFSEAIFVAQRIRCRLAATGLRTGDTVLSWAGMGLESVLLSWACFLGGYTFVPVDHEWPMSFVQPIIDEVRPAVTFVDDTRLAALGDPDRCPIHSVIVYDDQAEAGSADPRTFTRWLDQSETDARNTKSEDLPDATVGVILFTSGSTGKPKGVMLSHQALACSAQYYSTHFHLGPGDISLTLGGLHALGGIRNTCLSHSVNGSCGVLASSSAGTSVISLAELVRRLRCTYLTATPLVIRHFNLWAGKIDKACFATVKAILCTGSALDPVQADLFYQRTGTPILNYYGLTETTGFCAGHSLQTFLPFDGSIGPAVGAQLEVVDDHGLLLPAGCRGNLRVKSDQLMLGYHHAPELTAEVLRDGWFYTGDIAACRSDGVYQLYGRSRNVIKDEQSNLIHVEEIEMMLSQHPDVKDIVIVADQDDNGYEFLIALLVPTRPIPPEDECAFSLELNTFLQWRAGIRKTVRRYVLTDALPRGNGGKLLRGTLRDMLTRKYAETTNE